MKSQIIQSEKHIEENENKQTGNKSDKNSKPNSTTEFDKEKD